MSLNQLLTLVALPDCPQEVGLPESWPTIEATLGTQLPNDYKEFINLFGSGVFAGYIRTTNPFSLYPRFRLEEQIASADRTLAQLKNFYTEDFRNVVSYPQPGGLLVFANTLDGELLFWRTVGEPDAWTITIINLISGRIEEYQMSMAEFYISYVKGEISSQILPEPEVQNMFETI